MITYRNPESAVPNCIPVFIQPNKMFIGSGKFEVGKKVNSFATGQYTVYWQGLIYSNGVNAGLDTIRSFVSALESGLTAAAHQLKGMFFVVVHDGVSRKIYAFVDSSGLFHVFHSEIGLSTSFLDLMSRHQLAAKDIDPESLVEFFHFGYLSFGKTFFKQIQRLDPQTIVCVSETGEISLLSKMPCDIGIKPQSSFEGAIQSFCGSVRSERLSLDLTGGIDSRLLAVALRYFGVPFELAVSGEDDSEEVSIARQVAGTLSCPLHIIHHDITDFGDSILKLFTATDGLFDLAAAHGPIQMQQQRRSRDITLMVTGVGGELFKDFWWVQDFPFYGRKRSNLERLYDFRIVSSEPAHEYLCGAYTKFSREYRQRTLHQLQHYVSGTNTQTYDRIYYYGKMRDVAGRFFSNHVGILQCYAPYLEPEIAAIGYHLPRLTRFFNRFHRASITRYSPAAARIPTTAGRVSVSNEFLPVASDLLRYAQHKLKRIGQKLSQRVLHRQIRMTGPTNPGLYAVVRQHPLTQAGLQKLQESGIVDPALRLEHVRDEYLGRIMSLGVLLIQLEQAIPSKG